MGQVDIYLDNITEGRVWDSVKKVWRDHKGKIIAGATALAAVGVAGAAYAKKKEKPKFKTKVTSSTYTPPTIKSDKEKKKTDVSYGQHVKGAYKALADKRVAKEEAEKKEKKRIADQKTADAAAAKIKKNIATKKKADKPDLPKPKAPEKVSISKDNEKKVHYQTVNDRIKTMNLNIKRKNAEKEAKRQKDIADKLAYEKQQKAKAAEAERKRLEAEKNKPPVKLAQTQMKKKLKVTWKDKVAGYSARAAERRKKKNTKTASL